MDYMEENHIIVETRNKGLSETEFPRPCCMTKMESQTFKQRSQFNMLSVPKALNILAAKFQALHYSI